MTVNVSENSKRDSINQWFIYCNCSYGQFQPNFQVEGDVFQQPFFARLGHWMPYDFAADSFRTKKLCSTLSSKKVHFYRNNGHFCILEPPLGAYRQRTLFISGSLARSGLCISDNWTLFTIDITAEVLQAKIDWKSAFLKERVGPVWPKILGRRGRPHQPYFVSLN